MTAVMTPPKPLKKSAAAAPPAPHRWTIPEYRELGKTGLFQDVKTMLLHGEIYIMPMPSPPPDSSLNRADAYLRSICPAGHHLRNQQGFDIGSENDPGPDLALVRGTFADYDTRTPTSAVLIVEVAVSSLHTDLNVKPELYAAAKVFEYWVLDVEGRELHIFRDSVAEPVGRGPYAYRSHQTLAVGETASPLAAPTATVQVEELLPKIQ